MRAEIYPIVGDKQTRATTIQEITALLYSEEDDIEVMIRPVEKDKTLKQLGALFGLWKREISEQTGESIPDIHKRLKYELLSQLYLHDPKNNEQLIWAELCVGLLIHDAEPEVRQEHNHRISLSWCTKDQMIQYIEDIHAHCMSNGIHLSEAQKIRGLRIGKAG